MPKYKVTFIISATDSLEAHTWADRIAEDTDNHPDVNEINHKVVDAAPEDMGVCCKYCGRECAGLEELGTHLEMWHAISMALEEVDYQ